MRCACAVRKRLGKTRGAGISRAALCHPAPGSAFLFSAIQGNGSHEHNRKRGAGLCLLAPGWSDRCRQRPLKLTQCARQPAPCACDLASAPRQCSVAVFSVGGGQGGFISKPKPNCAGKCKRAATRLHKRCRCRRLGGAPPSQYREPTGVGAVAAEVFMDRARKGVQRQLRRGQRANYFQPRQPGGAVAGADPRPGRLNAFFQVAGCWRQRRRTIPTGTRIAVQGGQQ